MRLITDAGGDYIYKKNTGNASTSIDMEEAYLLASDADVWLNVGMANTLEMCIRDRCQGGRIAQR